METESRQLYRKLTEKAIGLIAEVGALVRVTYIHAYTNTLHLTSASIHTYIHTYIHTCMHTYIHMIVP